MTNRLILIKKTHKNTQTNTKPTGPGSPVTTAHMSVHKLYKSQCMVNPQYIHCVQKKNTHLHFQL